MTDPSWKAVSIHAVRRARSRYDVELTEEQWTDVVAELRSGKYPCVGRRQGKNGDLFRHVLLVPDRRGRLVKMPVLVSPDGAIVTVLPKTKPRRRVA